MTWRNQSRFPLEGHFSRKVVAEFAGSRLTTEGGSLLLREADRKIGLLKRVARRFTDARDPQRIEHELSRMICALAFRHMSGTGRGKTKQVISTGRRPRYIRGDRHRIQRNRVEEDICDCQG